MSRTYLSQKSTSTEVFVLIDEPAHVARRKSPGDCADPVHGQSTCGESRSNELERLGDNTLLESPTCAQAISILPMLGVTALIGSSWAAPLLDSLTGPSNLFARS